MEDGILNRLGGLGALVLALAWIISAPLGMIYWGMKEWLLGVVLSVIVPGFGMVSTAVSVVS